MSEKPRLQILVRDTKGLSTVEYIILLVLVAVIAITAWRTFGETVRKKVAASTTRINNEIDTTPASTQ